MMHQPVETSPRPVQTDSPLVTAHRKILHLEGRIERLETTLQNLLTDLRRERNEGFRGDAADLRDTVVLALEGIDDND